LCQTFLKEDLRLVIQIGKHYFVICTQITKGILDFEL
jgi:hypothetical protein